MCGAALGNNELRNNELRAFRGHMGQPQRHSRNMIVGIYIYIYVCMRMCARWGGGGWRGGATDTPARRPTAAPMTHTCARTGVSYKVVITSYHTRQHIPQRRAARAPRAPTHGVRGGTRLQSQNSHRQVSVTESKLALVVGVGYKVRYRTARRRRATHSTGTSMSSNASRSTSVRARSESRFACAGQCDVMDHVM